MKWKPNKRSELLTFAKGSNIKGEQKIWIVLDGLCQSKGYPKEVIPFDMVINIVCDERSNIEGMQSGFKIAESEDEIDMLPWVHLDNPI